MWELPESGLVMPLTPLDLNNIHSTNIYPRHQRSHGGSSPGPGALLLMGDPPEGPWAAGTGRRAGICCGVWPEAEVSPVSRGARGRGLALQHLHGVTQCRLAGARCPACMLTLPPARANICGQEASSVSLSSAGGHGVSSGPSAARVLLGQPAGPGSSACTHT